MPIFPLIRQTLVALILLIIPASAGLAQQSMDEDFARAVREWTTRPEFMSPLVDHLPRVKGVPSPKDFLGYHIGEPKRLTKTERIYGYYRALAAASPRVKVISIGRTDEGRECLVVFISSEESIRNLEQHRLALAQLADPRQIGEEKAREIISSARPIYHLMAGLHSGETGPPEMLMELAYRLVVEDSPLIRQIRDQVIVSLTPVAEPDGRDRYVEWYYRHKLDEKSEQDSVGGPPYWGKYIFHDNNRDTNYSQVTMRNLLEWYLQWHPPVMHDLHESVPFLYTFSGQAPQQAGLDPLIYGELPWFANFEMAQLIKYGMPGVWTHGFVDMWSPGYLAFMSSNHNGLVRMYETFGNGGANTMKRQVAPPQGGAGQTSREWYRPLPPYREVEWSLRNNTNYMQTAVLTALQLTSEFPRVILENFYRKSRNSIEAGLNEAPYGFIIPPQADMTRIQMAVNQLRTQGIEIGRSVAEIKVTEGTFPAGSFIIKRNQPYGRLAKILIEKQNFPDPNLRTYDDTGWTLGLMTRTKIVESADKTILEVATEPVDRLSINGRVGGADRPTAWIIPNLGSNNQITLRYRLKGFRVLATEKAVTIEGREYPAGSMVVPNEATSTVLERLRSAIAPLGLEAVGLAALPNVATHEVDLPRLAVYSTWG
ncbi:MAG: M14 family zinc carboxypeptidase, partial [Acidobacteriota bacterium]